MRTAVLAVVVLVVLLVVGDRVGAAVAEGVVADTLQTSQHLPSQPEVDISGFPFLSQLIARDFDQITVVARDVPIAGSAAGLRFSQVTAVMSDVKVDFSLDRVTIGTGTAIAVIGYADLSKELGADVSYAGHGDVKVSKTVTIAGHSFSPGVTVSPMLVGGALALFGTSVPLDRIPFELQLQSVTAVPAGIAITLRGRNITFTKR
jgi:hypothetical protein